MKRTTLIVFSLLLSLYGGRIATAQSSACCLPDGSCLDVDANLQTFCDALGGVWMGIGTSCATDSCFGACVINNECTENVNVNDCLQSGGTFLGSGTNCPVVIGSCCLPDGNCVDQLTPDQCSSSGGFFQGDNTDCATTSCNPVGACCISETGECLDNLTFFDCEIENPIGTGVWQGPGTTCATTSCPIFGFGACCLPDGQCFELMDEGECMAQGGTYAGDNVECVAAGCCPWDVNNDGSVNVFDLLEILANWGDCPPNPASCPWDINGSSTVDVFDLLDFLKNFNAPC